MNYKILFPWVPILGFFLIHCEGCTNENLWLNNKILYYCSILWQIIWMLGISVGLTKMFFLKKIRFSAVHLPNKFDKFKFSSYLCGIKNKTMKIICGLLDRMFWIVEYDDYTLRTHVKTSAYGIDGEFTEEVKMLLELYKLETKDLHFGTPLKAIFGVLLEEQVNTFMTLEKQEELTNLFKK